VETSNMGLGYVPGSFRKTLSVSQNADPQARSTHSSFRQPHFNSQSASRVSIMDQEEEYEEPTSKRDAKQGYCDPEAVSSREARSDGVQMKSSRRWRRLKSAGAIRGGARVGGRCQWAVRAVRVELRRRAWGVLSGQARLQVGGHLRSFFRGRFHPLNSQCISQIDLIDV
jgi:hypothetical protein